MTKTTAIATVLEFEPFDLSDADSPCTAELAECQCPDFCERDHGNE
jgi:hypothetical protein